jgi:hypothetical protein
MDIGIWEAIKYNWAQIREPLPLKSKDQFENEFNEERDLILKEKEEMTKEFQDKYSYKNIQMHKDNVIKM